MTTPGEPDPDHPVIHQPWKYWLIRFDLHLNRDRFELSYLDLWLQLESEVRRLRFNRPIRIRIEPGFPEQTYGRPSDLVIRDIRARGLENIGVEVTGIEPGNDGIRFLAESVVELK